MHHCHCVFPSPAEEVIATIPGAEPGTAVRVLVETSADGYVRLQHLAYDQGLGWYVQKSMVLPRELLDALIPQLRKAACLMAPARRTLATVAADRAPLRLVQPRETDDLEPIQRLGS